MRPIEKKNSSFFSSFYFVPAIEHPIEKKSRDFLKTREKTRQPPKRKNRGCRVLKNIKTRNLHIKIIF